MLCTLLNWHYFCTPAALRSVPQAPRVSCSITDRCQRMMKACHYHGISLLMLGYVLGMFSITFRLTSNIYIYYIHHATYQQLLTQFLSLFTSVMYHGRSSVTLL